MGCMWVRNFFKKGLPSIYFYLFFDRKGCDWSLRMDELMRDQAFWNQSLLNCFKNVRIRRFCQLETRFKKIYLSKEVGYKYYTLKSNSPIRSVILCGLIHYHHINMLFLVFFLDYTNIIYVPEPIYYCKILDSCQFIVVLIKSLIWLREEVIKLL